MKYHINIVIKYFFITLLCIMPQIAKGSVDVNFLSYELDRATHTAKFVGLGLIWVNNQPTFKQIENLTIPETIDYEGETYTVTTIGSRAGQRGYISGTLTLPNTLTTIEDQAFYWCDKLTGSLTIPNSVTYIGANAFRDCTGFDGELILSNSLKTIEEKAFYGCTFTGTLVIPDKVEKIGDQAFYICKGISKVEMGNSVKYLGERAFESCDNLTEVTLSESLTSIGDYAFQFCHALKAPIIIPNSVTHIGTHAFSSCEKLQGLILGENVTEIKDYAFNSCEQIAGELKLPDKIKTIGEYAFYGCSKLSGDLILPNSLSHLGKDAFFGCIGIKGKLKIPESLTIIEEATFFQIGVEEIYIPRTMEAIGRNALSSTGYSDLKLVVCEAPIPPVRYKPDNDTGQYDWIWTFAATDKYEKQLLVPAESVELYKSSPYWSIFKQINAIGSQIPATDIELNYLSAKLHIGESIQLNATLTPETTTDQNVTWTTSNASVATVNVNGKVTAVSLGNATITATAASGVTASCEITVEPVRATSISLNTYSISLIEGESCKIHATVLPDNTTNPTISWTSGDSQIATISRDGTITAIHKGVTQITATCDGVSATCTVTVNKQPEVPVVNRPETPSALIRKGNGASCTFIVMMDIPDEDLSDEGYNYIFGYTDAQDVEHILADTQKRYCHINSSIYNNPQNVFWVFAYCVRNAGTSACSYRRHLNGKIDEDFESSKFFNRSSVVDASNPANWIKPTSRGIQFTVECCDITTLSVYTLSGQKVFERQYQAGEFVDEQITNLQLEPNTYVAKVISGNETVTKKIRIQ